ncbi:MAG: hypothetical protein ACI8Y4_004979 [Candidatus Poriferisodalaceae bacterium]|jgi:hypothetical protein
MNTPPDADHLATVVAEIEAEAERRIASGEYPRALLRSLDEEFRRWIPDGSREHGIEDAIRSIETASYIDAGVPVDSNKAIGRYIKTSVRKATYFYHRHMAQQITTLGIQITRPMRLLDNAVKNLDARVAAVEHAVDINVAGRDQLLAGLLTTPVPDDLTALVARHISGCDGRVMVAEATSPSVVATLDDQTPTTAMIYGVGPGADPHPTLEMRDESAIEHLTALPDQSLHGAVVINLTDRLALNEQLRTLGLVAARSVDGSRLAVLVTAAEHWSRNAGPVVADLLGGRPLHPETWVHLLTHEGATDIEVHPSTNGEMVAITATLAR